MKPLVSVVMPTYNCGKYIAQSIESIIAQTISDWEVEIVDDCSTDDTYEVLRPYLCKYPNIHYHCLDANSGPAVARTEAIKRASGKYIAFLDSDDLWLEHKLEKQIAFMEGMNAVFSCTAYAHIDENDDPLLTGIIPPKKTDYQKMLRLSNPLGNSTVVYNQEALGKYEIPPIQKRNDFALWLRILHDASHCVGMPEILTYYRIRKNSISRKKLPLVKFHWKLYYEIEHLGLPRSVWYIFCWAFVKGTGIGINKVKAEKV